MHVGSVEVFDGILDYEEFVKYMDERLPLLPRYRQRVTPAPFNVGHPTWEFDHQFNIRNHIMFTQLAAPGDDTQLSITSGKLLSGMLSRNKPLWEMYIVHGLAGGRSALVSKVHHAMIDGISGVDLTKITFEISPNPAPAPKIDFTPPPPKSSNITKDLVDAWLDSVEEGMRGWNEFQNGLLNLTNAFVTQSNNWLKAPNTSFLPALSTPVPMLPFNQKPLSGERRLVWSEFSFAEARAIRGALGGTVNDVVLTILSGAITRYVKLHGQRVRGRMLRVMVPVSMRREEQRGALGNLVSVLPVEIPLDLENPVERLHYISNRTGELKESRLAESANMFSALLGVVPAQVQALVGSMAATPIPVFNTVCTNVPGPQIPLYCMGKRLVAWYPYVPIGYGLGVGCAIMSYDQKLFFGLTSDLQAMPDVEKLNELLNESFAEIKQVAQAVK
jgi:WS/DGAT/MGAT family acyltransferase